MFQRVCHRSLVLGLWSVLTVGGTPNSVVAQAPRPAVTAPRPASTNPGRSPVANPATPAGASQPAPVPNAGGASSVPQTRPDGNTPRPTPDPQLVRILQIWEQHTGKIKRMEGDFLRYEYESVFRVEKRHIGKYYYEAPDQGRMDFLPYDIKKQPLPAKNEANGFQVVNGTPESWICNGEELLSVQVADKTYHKMTIPPNYRGEAIKDGPLPFLFGMKTDEALRKYDMEFGGMHMQKVGDKDPLIHIVAYPLMPEQRREFQRAEMLINPKTFEPVAVKLFDPSGNKETVYAFQKHDEVTIPWLTPKFKVNLMAYKCLNEEKAPPKRETMRQDPNAPVIR